MGSQKIFMGKGWLNLLQEEFNKKPYMKDLQKFLIAEKKQGHTIYPPEELIFNAFCQTPFDQVKVIIMGQDPYHGPGQSQGLAFSVSEGIAQPPSLRNIFKELVADLNLKYPRSGSLLPWAQQGVLLLNTTLTVRKATPLSHKGKGWELLTDKVIEILAQKKDHLVFLLWGKEAQGKCLKIIEQKNNHLILTAAHPSFYSAANFFGCKHFSKTNEFLKKNHLKPIDWQIA